MKIRVITKWGFAPIREKQKDIIQLRPVATNILAKKNTTLLVAAVIITGMNPMRDKQTVWMRSPEISQQKEIAIMIG